MHHRELRHLASSVGLDLQGSAARSASLVCTDHLPIQIQQHALFAQQGITRTVLDRHLACLAGWGGTRIGCPGHLALIVLLTRMQACKHLRAVEAVLRAVKRALHRHSALLAGQARCEWRRQIRLSVMNGHARLAKQVSMRWQAMQAAWTVMLGTTAKMMDLGGA